MVSYSERKGNCRLCSHYEMCSWKPNPYMGTHSGGILLHIGYDQFRDELYQVYGKHCKSYDCVITTTSSVPIVKDKSTKGGE